MALRFYSISNVKTTSTATGSVGGAQPIADVVVAYEDSVVTDARDLIVALQRIEKAVIADRNLSS